MLDENISGEEHIRTVETKLAKNIGLLYRAKLLHEEKKYLFCMYSFIPELC